MVTIDAHNLLYLASFRMNFPITLALSLVFGVTFSWAEEYSPELVEKLNKYSSGIVIKAKAGDAEAQCKLGDLFNGILGIPADYKEAAKWYTKAAEQGNSSAQWSLGLLYSGGLGVNKNEAEAVRWFMKSAEGGNDTGQLWLGISYLGGLGIEKDEKKATKWFRKSAEQGNSNARMYLNGLKTD